MSTIPKIVISRTLAQATWAGTRIISSHAEEELARLKQQPGKDIVIPGSSTLTAGLLQTGLFDELRRSPRKTAAAQRCQGRYVCR